ncbi:MAG: hypothetical protein IV100_33350 [Myxococcales bacterium]|nr:hypothetical protein [Myxococcales bacterium]
MVVNQSSSWVRRAATALVIMVVGALPLAAIVMAIVPVSKRLTAPILCPAGTVRAFVVSYTEHPKPGTTSFKSELVCEGADGKLDRTGAFMTWFVLSGYAALGIGLNMAKNAALAKGRRGAPRDESGIQGGGPS